MKKICLLTLLFFCLSLSLLACSETDPTSNGQSLSLLFQTPNPNLPVNGPTAAPVASPVLPDGASPTQLPGSSPVVAPTPTPGSDSAQTEVESPATVTAAPLTANQTTATTGKVGVSPGVGKATTGPANSIPKTTQATQPVTTRGNTVPTFTPVPTVSGPTYNTALSEVVRGRSGRKQVALTIDAGADGKAFPKIMAALNQYNIHITFFLTGQWVQQNPQFTQQIVANGQEIANHSWDHPDFTKLTDDQARDEIQKAEAMLTRFTGRTPRPLWRFPYGARNSHMQQVVNALGYRSVFWTIDSLDSVGQPKTAQFLIDRITKQSDAQLDGEIILMHIGNSTTGDALPEILSNLKQRGFQIVTVSQLLS